MKCDVLIAGAGPVGLTMAAELTRYGLSVRIVEKSPQRSDKSRALVLWSRTLELMDRIGCTGNFLAAGMKAHAANLSAGGEPIFRITFDDVPTPYPFALMIPQGETERLLEELLNRLGVQVERSVELTRFTTSDSQVTATLRHADGREETVEAPWLIGCDGAHSAVRHQLNLEFKGSTHQSDFMLADLHLSGVPAPDEISAFWHADGVLIIFPIAPGRYRVVADLGPTDRDHPRPDPTLQEVQAVLDKRGPGGMTGSDPIWLANFHINERKVQHYRHGRVFLAGDAAHIHSPAGGQGMNTGMQDAFNLAWKLALVFHGTCPQNPVLDSYSPERSGVGDEVLKTTGRFTAIAIMQGAVKQSIRNHVASLLFGLAPVRRLAANTIEELSIGYPDSPMNAIVARQGPHPHAGERAPIRAGESPVGAGDRPRFALFGDANDRFAQLAAQHAAILEPKLRKPYHEGGLWLVRPDGYVALAATRDGWGDVAAYLANLVGA